MFTKHFKNIWVQNLLLIFIYVLAGKLGHHISLPPGKASLIWAPFGLSIAALLLFGINRFPAVFFGALFTNTDLLFSKYWPTNIIISFGATVSVITGVLLIKRFIKYPKSYFSQKDVLLFLILAGPIPAIINGAIQVTALLYSGLLHSQSSVLTWIYWWTGDSIGAFIFAPLALIFCQRPQFNWKKSFIQMILPSFVFIFTLIGTLKFFNSMQNEKDIAHFKHQANESYFALKSFSESLEDRLYGLFVFFDNSTNVSETEFNNVVEFLGARQPEILGMIWIPWNSEKPTEFKIGYSKMRSNDINLNKKDLSNQNKWKSYLLKLIGKPKIGTKIQINLDPLGIKEPTFLQGIYSQKHSGFLVSIISLKSLNAIVPYDIQKDGFRVEIFGNNNNHTPITIYDNLKNNINVLKFDNTPGFFSKERVPFGDQYFTAQFSADLHRNNPFTFSNIYFLTAAIIFTYITCAIMTITHTQFLTIEELVDKKTMTFKQLNKQLQDASRSKSAFISNMSHEIRTPLNVLIGITDILNDSTLTAEKKHYIEIAKKSGESLLNIVNDILDLSKIEAGLMKIENETFHLKDLVKSIYEMFKILADQKDIEFKVEYGDEIAEYYMGDPLRIRQILFNLISNAIKFTEGGKVTLKIGLNKRVDEPRNIHFEVIDTGIGIHQDQMKNIFQPFHQADSTIIKKYGGTGLGLSICKHLANLMKGTLHCQSVFGHGSTFALDLTLPEVKNFIPAQSNSKQPKESILYTKNYRTEKNERPTILIVDDLQDNRLLLRAYLKGQEIKIFEAEDGISALNSYQKHKQDLILMDMQMPIMDGITATQQIRNWEKENNISPTQIWALTAYALREEMQKSLRAGCNQHLTKPIQKSELLQSLASFMNLKNSQKS